MNDLNLSNFERADVAGELKQKRDRLRTLTIGASIGEWTETLARHPLIGELFAREGGQHQLANTWSQQVWERNRGESERQAGRLMAQEFAAPSWNLITLETLGLAEVVYPDIDTVRPPNALLGRMREAAGALLSQCWPQLLSAICDTLRRDHAVTLGSADADSGGFYFPLGSWVSASDRSPAMVPMIGDVTRTTQRIWSCRYCNLRSISCWSWHRAARLGSSQVRDKRRMEHPETHSD